MMKNNRPQPVKVMRTQSFEMDQLSPLMSPQTNKKNPAKNFPAVRHFNSLPTQLPDTPKSPSQQELLNTAQRELITKLAQLFVTEQSPKPGKIFIRVNSLCEQLLQKGQACRINKVQICRYEQHQITSAKQQMKWEEGNCSVFSFKDMPQVAGVLINNGSSAKASPVVVNNPLAQSELIEEKNIDSSNFTISRKINISYKPINNRPHRPSFYRPTSPNTSSATPQIIQKQPSIAQESDNKEVNEGRSQKFINLAGLDIFMRHRELENSDHQHRLRLLKKLEKQYKQLEAKKKEEAAELKGQLQRLQQQLQLKNRQFKQLMDNYSQVSKKLTQEMNKLTEEKKSKEMYKKGGEQLLAQVKELKKCIKQMKQQMAIKDSMIMQSKEKEKLIIEGSQTQNGKHLSEQDIQKITSSIFKMASDKNIANHPTTYPSNINNLLSALTVPPTHQQVYHHNHKIQFKRNSRVSIMNNANSNSGTTPLIRAFKSTEPAIRPSIFNSRHSRDSSQSPSMISNITRKSALKSIGFVKSTKEDSSGILCDYMEEGEYVEAPWLGLKNVENNRQEQE